MSDLLLVVVNWGQEKQVYLILLTMLIVAMVAMWVAVLYVIYRGCGPWLRSRLMDVRGAPATVIDKRDKREYVLSADFGPRLGTPQDEPREDVTLEPIQWFVTFELEENEVREYPVRQSDYEAVAVGDRGKLYWRGELFVRFVPTIDTGSTQRLGN